MLVCWVVARGNGFWPCIGIGCILRMQQERGACGQLPIRPHARVWWVNLLIFFLCKTIFIIFMWMMKYSFLIWNICPKSVALYWQMSIWTLHSFQVAEAISSSRIELNYDCWKKNHHNYLSTVFSAVLWDIQMKFTIFCNTTNFVSKEHRLYTASKWTHNL